MSIEHAFLSGSKIEQEPNLLFDKSDTSAVHPQVYWGLRKYGPYDKDRSVIRIILMSPRNKMNSLKGIVRDLNNGTPIMPGGMKRFFRCIFDIVDEVYVDSLEVHAYESASINFTRRFDPREVDVVLVYIPKTSRYFSNTPYYRVKAILASEGYASQMVTNSTFDNLKWSYLNLASALFSKAGGIPWVLEEEMKNVDILLGISISHVISKKRRAGELPKYVGYVNVFDNYGKWMFFEGTATPYEKEKKLEQLRELILKAIQRFRAEKKISPRNIIIHYYKRWGREEKAYIIKTLEEQVEDFNVGFVSIDDSHPFRLYDITTNDGSFPRGYYVYLSKDEMLMSTTGHTPIAARRMGTPKLLHIRLEQYPSSFMNIDDVALQILSLTKLDWATAMPFVREPVTLQFSREIAYLTAVISAQEWQSITRPEVNVILSRRPWFI
ncbi:hypothetical protein J7L00_01090 [Candidatus Bathyarchaeota archaeon]|nr:hypothetical protein [Candidatus Bathyarchaeota archaeon]